MSRRHYLTIAAASIALSPLFAYFFQHLPSLEGIYVRWLRWGVPVAMAVLGAVLVLLTPREFPDEAPNTDAE